MNAFRKLSAVLLVAWAGAPSAFVLAAVLSFAAVGLLWRLPEPVRPTDRPLTV